MAAPKLVKKLFVLILFSANLLRLNAMRTINEKGDIPEAHIVYDQRQSGKYNIHVVIKDVAIIEMDQNKLADQNYYDDEYYYDEEGLTVKPLILHTTTTAVKPLNYTTKNKTTTPIMKTTVLSTQTYGSEEAQNLTQETLSLTLSANISNTIDQRFNNNIQNSTNTSAVDTKSQTEPTHPIQDTVLQPRHHLEDFNDKGQSRNFTLTKEDSSVFANSRIFKVKLHRSHREPQATIQMQRCSSYQYRDPKGNCRTKLSSSGSILKRLIRMLITLPFKPDEQQIDD